MKCLNLLEVAENTEVQHLTESENERHMTVLMPNGNRMEVNTTTGAVITTVKNRVNYHGKMSIIKFIALRRELLTKTNYYD